MPNWAEGSLKLRGKCENIASALKEMLLNDTVTLEEEWDGDLLVFNNTAPYFYINKTRRAFINQNQIEVWLEEEFCIVELDNFQQAWSAIPENSSNVYEWDLVKCIKWVRSNWNLFVRAWKNGYEIEAEKLYRISMPKTENYKGHIQVLCEEKDHLFWCGEWKRFKTEFTKKRLEKAGFGELFDSKLFHVEEVKDGRLD